VRPTPLLPRPLQAVVNRELGAAGGQNLVAHWLRGEVSTAVLVDASRGLNRESWELRRAAALMLEHQWLLLGEADAEAVCSRLGIVPPREAEGYTATTIGEMAAQLRVRLARNARVHARIRGLRTSPAALAAFLYLARRECRLTLARYLFTADEITARIRTQVRTVPGVRDATADAPPPFASKEAPRTLEELPDLERTLLRALGEPPQTYWVGNATTSEINALVEYPLGTVAMAIKLPGSTTEIEIKRTGQRGPAILGAGCKPYHWTRSHYIRGASSKPILVWEAAAASFVCSAYRLVHGCDAPVSRTIYLSNVTSVPAERGPVNVIRYFTDPSFHDGGFDALRAAIHSVVTEELGPEQRPVPEHDAALSGAFVGLISPGQAILCGSSSFRLDTLARHLSPDGAERYFSDGLGIAYTPDDARAFADELLDEVLATYTPPATRARTYGGYVGAAIAANRDRADSCYLDVLDQIGRFWGTMSALRIVSNGESFVARNVGLRAVWEQAQWRVRVIFMDHDGMAIPGKDERDFQPASFARPAMNDYRHIFGGRLVNTDLPGELGALRKIYQPGAALARKAAAIVRRSARAAYDATQAGFETNGKLRALYGDRFATRQRDWDRVAAGYLGASRAQRDAWESETRATLSARGYGANHVEAFVTTVRGFSVLLRKTACLYRNADARNASDSCKSPL
jgi:hypothetical protein